MTNHPIKQLKTILAQHLYTHHNLTIPEISKDIGWNERDVAIAIDLLDLPSVGVFESNDNRKNLVQATAEETDEERRIVATRKILGDKSSSIMRDNVLSQARKLEKEQSDRGV